MCESDVFPLYHATERALVNESNSIEDSLYGFDLHGADGEIIEWVGVSSDEEPSETTMLALYYKATARIEILLAQ